jgi:hypothetical protein
VIILLTLSASKIQRRLIIFVSLQAVVLEGKYWKRKLATVTAEYKKWRMFYKNKIMGWTSKEGDNVVSDLKILKASL